MENEQQAVEEQESAEVESDTAESESAPDEEIPTLTEDEDGSTEPETDDQPESEDSAKPTSKKAENRYQKLANEKKRLEMENQRLRQAQGQGLYQTAQSAPAPAKSPFPWEQTPPQTNDEDGLTLEELNKRIELTAEAKAEEKVQELIRTQDAERLETLYPELSENSDSFNPKLTNFVADQYNLAVKQYPKLRLADFVNEFMSLREESIDQGRTQAASTLVEQAAKQAVTPSSGKTSTQSTEEELAQALKDGRMSLADFEAQFSG